VYRRGSALKRPRSYRFYQIFSFESLLALLILNLDHWFVGPIDTLQILSWALLLASTLLAVQGFYLLHAVGQPRRGIEKTIRLVQVGVYRYIRHPLYSSLLCLGWGAFLAGPSLAAGMLVLIASGFLVATAKLEEQENRRRFGIAYVAYMKKTKMFIPFLF
jgi:protein-S-isoprenylcysteine O-methyltransferase Ste14